MNRGLRRLPAASVLLITGLSCSCVRSGFDGRPDLAAGRDRSRADKQPDTGPASSCLTWPLTTPAYATVSFSDFATAWSTVGTGSWSVSGGQLVQSSTTAALAYAHHAVSFSDYRVVATLHYTSGGTGKAVEIALRINPASSSMYHCNWEPSGNFIIQYTSGAKSGPFLIMKTIALGPGPDWSTATMEFQAVGTTLQCCLRGVTGAYLSATDSQFSSGAVGVKTYLMSGTFRDFAAYR